MAQAVAQSLAQGDRLLVQAGTGTGKSFGYLAPVAAWLADHPSSRAVVATATLALQTQLATADIPLIVAGTAEATGHQLSWSLLKGRSNYLCLLRARDRVGLDGQDELALRPTESESESEGWDRSGLGAEVVALRRWAEDVAADPGASGDRDDAPAHSPQAWRQVSVSSWECVGPQACPYVDDCLAERARDRARGRQLVVTNHALVAVDAESGGAGLPDHDLIVLDEAHQLPAQVTSAATVEMSPQAVERAARRAAPWLSQEARDELDQAAEQLRAALDSSSPGRVEHSAQAPAQVCRLVQAAARRATGELAADRSDPNRSQAAKTLDTIWATAERMAAVAEADVLWVSQREQFGRQLVIAPLSVAAAIRERVLGSRKAVLTSATLALGGGFAPMALSLGLDPAAEVVAAAPQADPGGTAVVPRGGSGGAADRAAATVALQAEPAAGDSAGETGEDDPGPVSGTWRSLDVGSPFDYPRQGILYVARQLPPPGRDGLSPAVLDEIADLVQAARGRTLGLFSSLAGAQAAAERVRRRDLEVLCQGEGHLAELVRRFVAREDLSLFGSISLWQGVDAPGQTCRLVVIDRIPFPRPDEPLTQARQRDVARRGGNGFMQVAASQAALLLAQGAGRLIRRSDDRGVVAILDSRLATARYGAFLARSLPPFWATTDRERVLEALGRLG
jgi:ATP-dependent DNA helicase DinG